MRVSLSPRLRRALAWTCGWLAVTACIAQDAAHETPAAAPRKPCIILILADGLGYGDLGCYGQKRIRTPVIDQLAERGIRFTDFHAAAPDDEPSRTALLTGATQYRGLRRDVPTLAEHLTAAGYHTAYIGFWGLGGFDSANSAHRRGFAETAVYGGRQHANDLYSAHLFRKDVHTGFEGRVPLMENTENQRGLYLPDLLTRAAVNFCKQNKPEALNHFRPFLLVVSYPVPAAVGSAPGSALELGNYITTDWTPAQKARADAITRFDRHVGEIMDELENRGMARNTILLITSTRGPAGDKRSAADFFGSSGRFTSDVGPLSEGRLRVPLVASWPFWIRTPATSDLLSSGQDIVPTLLAAARLKPAEPIEGVSFLPLLQRQEQTNQHSSLQWEAEVGEGHRQRAVRQGPWKLVEMGDGAPVRLYDLTAPSPEAVDVAEQHPEVVSRLTRILRPDQTAGTIRRSSDR